MSQVATGKFSSTFLVPERDLANEVTNKLLRNGSIVINIYISTLLLFGSGSTTLFHLLGIFLLFASMQISINLTNRFHINSYYLINQSVLLAIPIVMEAHISRSWISYGLLVAIFVLFSATFEKTYLFITCLLLAPLIQFLVASQNLLGVTDNQDLLLLNSYFSTTWALIAGIGVRVARLVYLNYCEKIDEQLFTLQDQVIESEQRQSSLNLKDHINLAIHGTLLNTLISYNLMPDKLSKQKDLAKDLEQDLANIKALESTTSIISIESRSRQILEGYGIDLEFNAKDSTIILGKYLEPLIEIIREIGLNTKKHTNSRKVKIEIVNQTEFVSVNITEVFPESLEYRFVEAKLLGANNSASLLRIVNSARYDLKILSSAHNDSLIYQVKVPREVVPSEVISKVSYFRRQSLTRNIQLLTAVSVIYSYLAIIGFIFLEVPIYVELAVLFANLLVTYELIAKQKSKLRPIIAQVSLLTIIPYILFLNESCQNLLYTPWLFNAIFGALLYAISVAKNPLLKWGPGVLFIIENLATKIFFPQQCNTLLDGSTPGFIFLLIFGYLMAKLRERNTELDANLDSSIRESVVSHKELANYTALARNELINNLQSYILNFVNFNLSEQEFEKSLQITIQKIRAFLICSQHFESLLIKDLYLAISQRLGKNQPINISILSSAGLLNDLQTESKLINSIRLLSDKQCELIIKGDTSLSVELYEDDIMVFELKLLS